MAITYIDKTAPSTASLSVTDYDDSSITVKATGADALSGVAKYAFQLSTDGSSWTTKATKSSTASSYSYTYSSLSSSTTYYMRVRVYDAAGNYKTSSSVSQTTDSGVLYLYNYGDECEDVTGGWTYTYQDSSDWRASSQSYTIGDDYLYAIAPKSAASSSNSAAIRGWWDTDDGIDVSEYSSISATIKYYLYTTNSSPDATTRPQIKFGYTDSDTTTVRSSRFLRRLVPNKFWLRGLPAQPR